MTHPDSVGAGIYASDLARSLEEIAARPTAQDVAAYVRTMCDLDALWEELALFFDQEGTGTPELAAFHDYSSSRLGEIYAAVEAQCGSVELRSSLRAKLRDLASTGSSCVDTTDATPVTVATDTYYYGRTDSFEIIAMLAFLQHGVLRRDGKHVATMPRWIAQCVAQNHRRTEIIEGIADSTDLDAALTLWEPDDELSPYGTFGEALDSARRL